MNRFDSRVAERLHDMVDGDFDSAPPVGAVLDRAHTAVRRRSRVRVTAASLGVLAVAGVATVATVAGMGGAATTPSTVDAAAPGAVRSDESPLIRLQAAVSTTENVSYHIKVTTTVKLAKSTQDPSTPPPKDQVSTGAFDPATATGYLRTPFDDGPGYGEERLVNGTLYDGEAGIDGKPQWLVKPGRHTALTGPLAGTTAGGLSASADPTTLLANLGKEGATVTQTGSDTYHFTFDVPKQDLLPNSVYDKFAGDVRVGPDNRIASVKYERLLLWEPKPNVQQPNSPADMVVDMEFSDYGTPVAVEAPTGATPAR